MPCEMSSSAPGKARQSCCTAVSSAFFMVYCKDQATVGGSMNTETTQQTMPGEDANLPAAILGGLVAAIAGALVWALVTVSIKFQIGFMAVGVGFLVAWAVRTLGKGRAQMFGIIGG